MQRRLAEARAWAVVAVGIAIQAAFFALDGRVTPDPGRWLFDVPPEDVCSQFVPALASIGR